MSGAGACEVLYEEEAVEGTSGCEFFLPFHKANKHRGNSTPYDTLIDTFLGTYVIKKRVRIGLLKTKPHHRFLRL